MPNNVHIVEPETNSQEVLLKKFLMDSNGNDFRFGSLKRKTLARLRQPLFQIKITNIQVLFKEREREREREREATGVCLKKLLH